MVTPQWICNELAIRAETAPTTRRVLGRPLGAGWRCSKGPMQAGPRCGSAAGPHTPCPAAATPPDRASPPHTSPWDAQHHARVPSSVCAPGRGLGEAAPREKPQRRTQQQEQALCSPELECVQGQAPHHGHEQRKAAAR